MFPSADKRSWIFFASSLLSALIELWMLLPTITLCPIDSNASVPMTTFPFPVGKATCISLALSFAGTLSATGVSLNRCIALNSPPNTDQ